MIAQLKPPRKRNEWPSLVRARHLVADTLLERSRKSTAKPPRSVWKICLAWAWIAALLAAGAGLMHWVGIW